MIPGALRQRPRLLGAAAIGGAAGLAALGLGTSLPHAWLAGWCVAAASWLVMVVPGLLRAPAAGLRQRTAMLDEGRWRMLGGTLAAALASLGAVIWALAEAPHPAPLGTVLLGLGTVLLSWTFVHVLFALHYAHEHWRAGKGVVFPGSDAPGFDEFLYFAFTIGMTFQVSDATTETAPMRRLVLLHGVLAFLFNAVILAAAVNLAAALAT